MKLTTDLPLIDRDALYARAVKVLGDAFDPEMIGVRASVEGLTVKENKGSGGEGYELHGVASSGRLDEDEEVVLPGGLDFSLMTGRYKSVYTDHFYGTPNVVATMRLVQRSYAPDGWRIKAWMLPDNYGDHVRQTRMLADRDALGFSIGFMATDRSSPTTDEKSKYPGARSIVRKARVFEVSTTPMPCNLDCGASALWMDESKAASIGELVTKGLAPAWAGSRFVQPKRKRLVWCG